MDVSDHGGSGSGGIVQRRLSICEYAPIELSALDNEALKRRYRKKYENTDKIKELMIEQFSVVENLKTAIEGKMEIAVIGVLSGILKSLEAAASSSSDYISSASSSRGGAVDGGDLQRALFRCEVCPVVACALREMGGQVSVCERVLQTVAYLCRYSDEVKTSVCLENAKALGIAGVCELIVGAITRHPEDKRVIESACDAIRCICSLESNRDRLGNAGGCEALVGALASFSSSSANADVCSWICRAIGHIANSSDSNRETLGTLGVVENLILTMQKFAFSMQLCTEACWAIRQVAPNENNRARLANGFGPESIVAIYKSHVTSEAFATEACHALVNMLASETDDLIPRMAAAGLAALALRSLRKCPNSETLSRWAFQALYYISCDPKLAPKLITGDVLDLISMQLEQHAGNEGMAEWSTRTVHKLMLHVENVSSKMRNAGLCEMVCSTVQRQAISSAVSGIGCLVIGELAKDKSNHERLSSAGACEAVVGALKRHNETVDVVVNTCFAIHFLSMTENNVSWMGAYGACEAVTNALKKHAEKSPEIAKNACNAIGSLAFKDEGNQNRFRVAGGCPAVVNALKVHGGDYEIAEFACRAIFNLSAEPSNVTELGGQGCALVVAVLHNHLTRASVITQALLAMHGLAVKLKLNKLHKSNTKKLVKEGAIEMLVAAMQKFLNEEIVQRAAAMAISSLSLVNENRDKLGECGACDLIIKSLKTHVAVEEAATKLTGAIEALANSSPTNVAKLTALDAMSLLLNVFQRHEKSASVVAEAFRALITLSSVGANQQRAQNENAFKLYIKALKTHEKNPLVCRWGCSMIYAAATETGDRKKSMLGNVKACDAVINVISKHGTKDADCAEWACKALVALSTLPSNKAQFLTTEACSAVVASLEALYREATVAEWAASALVTLASSEAPYRAKLGSVGACKVVCTVMNFHHLNETIVQLLCGVLYELAREPPNRPLFVAANAISTVLQIFQHHVSNVTIATAICRAVASLGQKNPDIAVKLCADGLSGLVATGLKTHLFAPGFILESCSLINSLCTESSSACKDSFGSFNVLDSLSKAIVCHKNSDKVINQISKALKALTLKHTENQVRVAQSDIIITAMTIIKTHMAVGSVVENLCWLVGTVTYTGPDGVAIAAPRRRNSVTVRNVEPEAATAGSDRVYPHPREVYNDTANWEVLNTALRTHFANPDHVRWICAALSTFGCNSNVAHVSTCELLISCLRKHVAAETVVQKVLHAIGSLAQSSKENNAQFTSLKACEIVELQMAEYTEGNPRIYGILPAISGLAAQNPMNQTLFNESKTLCSNIAKVLYNELEDRHISQWGCAAVSSLVQLHPRNQVKLSNVCTFVADIFSAHKADMEVLTQVFKMTSALAHDNITNRNKLGANEVCQLVPHIFQSQISEMIFNPIFSLEHSPLYWATRAVADLAANNPNNQAKLGEGGACECLVRILHREITDGESELEKKLFASALWAIGNLVQLGKGPEMVMNSNDVSSRSGTGMNLNLVGNLKPATEKKSKKNSTRFLDQNIAAITYKVLMRYLDDVHIIMWALRAINNLCKSAKVRKSFLAQNILQAIDEAAKEYERSAEMMEWVTLTRDTLNNTTASTKDKAGGRASIVG